MANTIINTNVPALNSHRAILGVSRRQQQSSERLSTGMRINRAADDAAGLAISEKMRNQIRGLDQAVRNSQDGISLVQTAEGAMEEIHRILERVRVLTNQAANDTNMDDDRMQINAEIQQILAEVDQIANNTEFNEQRILMGASQGRMENPVMQETVSLLQNVISGLVDAWTTFTAVEAFLNIAGFQLDVSLAQLGTNLAELISGMNSSAAAIPEIAMMVQNFGNNFIDQIEAALLNQLGAFAPRDMPMNIPSVREAIQDLLIDMVSDITNRFTNLTTLGQISVGAQAFTPLSLADWNLNVFAISVAEEINEWIYNLRPTSEDFRIQGSQDPLRLQVQTGANALQRLDVSIQAMDLGAIEMGHFAARFERYARMEDVPAAGVGFSRMMDDVDIAIRIVSEQRANLGAIQNRLEHTINNLRVASENLSAANSRIRDTDMAQEMMRLTQANVLQQAGMSMLAQANMAPQQILQLLN